jgi:hypothetical protein
MTFRLRVTSAEAVYHSAIRSAHLVDTLRGAAQNWFTPFQIYRVVPADAHSCR